MTFPPHWVLIPIPHGKKAPKRKDWPSIRNYSPRSGENIGVHLGPSSLVDVDLDCPEAIDAAADLLPTTRTFGRGQAAHYLYSGEAEYRKFIDPIDGQCLLEIRAGEGKQTVLPGSTHPSGETIEWQNEEPIAEFRSAQEIAKFAAIVWCKRHPGTPPPEKVKGWITGAAPKTSSDPTDVPVFFDAVDEQLVETIVSCCPDKSRHDYRLAVAGAMKRGGIGEASASDMLAEAMGDPRLGEDRRTAVADARAAIQDTYHTSRNTTGATTLIALGGQKVVDLISALSTPTFSEIDWLEELERVAVGGSLEVFDAPVYVNSLARLILSKDSRLPAIWAKLKDGGFSHLKELKEAADLRAKEIRRRSVDPDAPQEVVDHPEGRGMRLPQGYSVEGGVLHFGDETIMHGELVLLGKCPSSEGVQVRFAWRTPSSPEWRTSVVPYRSLVDARGVLCLAEHGCNVSSLESAALVGFVRDFVASNEESLDRPIATRTGWHDSGAFVWGRHVLGGPEELSAEYPADNQIASHYVSALHSSGDRAKSFEALRRAVDFPTASLCLAASLASCWVHRAARPTVGVHLAGMGGKGKTRTLKIVGSVWGATGGAGSLSATGTIAGANTTVRALEIAASVRNDLPFLISDIRPMHGLTEVLHAILNGDSRARATQRGGSTLGEAYRCGAVISEGELNVLSLTTRQGFHRRMLELRPDPEVEELWRLASVCSEHYGFLGPAFLERLPEASRVTALEAEAKGVLGHDVAGVAATLLATAEAAAPVLGVDADSWFRSILQAIGSDREERESEGLTQADRVQDDLWEVLADLAPQIADTAESTLSAGAKPWVGYRTDAGVVVRSSAIKEGLKKKGHDATKDAIEALGLPKAEQFKVSGVRVRCYEIEL